MRADATRFLVDQPGPRPAGPGYRAILASAGDGCRACRPGPPIRSPARADFRCCRPWREARERKDFDTATALVLLSTGVGPTSIISIVLQDIGRARSYRRQTSDVVLEVE